MKNLLKQAVGFVGLSGIGWILDFCTYTVLGFLSENLVLNNFISSWVGVTFVFIFATRKIFMNNSRIPLKWKYLIYIAYQFVLIFLVSILLGKIDGLITEYVTVGIILKFSFIISKIIITPITMVLNFFGMKGLIEKI
ncbi:MAG: hypothetical protein IKD86_03125 [Firmicutes bacterium]|nr:hypothetical protein [Bacillota bacterium]